METASLQNKTVYMHEENAIDPRDSSIITHDVKTKRLICEASDLKDTGSFPQYHEGTIGKGFYISVWSEKFKLWCLFKENKKKRRMNDDEIVAEVYDPYWSSVTTEKEFLASQAFEGYELHIIND